jgi:hypothetical protein
MRDLAGTAVAKWLDVELPKVQNPRLDLLGETVDGGLVHVELQSGNDPAMPLRMWSEKSWAGSRASPRRSGKRRWPSCL